MMDCASNSIILFDCIFGYVTSSCKILWIASSKLISLSQPSLFREFKNLPISIISDRVIF